MITPLSVELRAAIDALEATCSALELLGEKRDQMAEIVQTRLALADGFMALNSGLDDGRLSNETKAQARTRLTEVRHIVSLHQASWPIVAARDDPEGYRTSALRASKASREFIDWMRRLPQQNVTGSDDY